MKVLVIAAIMASVMTVRLRNSPSGSTIGQELKDIAVRSGVEQAAVQADGRANSSEKESAHQEKLRKFIAESNKVKLIKWGEYDVYINQNCPQPPEQPQFEDTPELSPVRNCLQASIDSEEIAKEMAHISADAATLGIPVKKSIKGCFDDLRQATVLSLKPSTTKECFERSFDENFRIEFRKIQGELEQNGWKYDTAKEVFERHESIPHSTQKSHKAVNRRRNLNA